MQHLHTDVDVIIGNLHRMDLAVSHDVLAERPRVLAGITVVPYHLEVCFGFAVHDIANQDHRLG